MVDYVQPIIARYKRFILLEDNVKFVFNQHQGHHHFCFKSHIHLKATRNNKGSHETTSILLLQPKNETIFFCTKMHRNHLNLLMMNEMHSIQFAFYFVIKLN